MKLVVTMPTAIVVEAEDVRSVRAEDESGAFGVLPRHADFLTVLPVSVLTWRDAGGGEHHVALRGGMLRVSERGQRVAVASREAVPGDDLEALRRDVIARFQHERDAEAAERHRATRLHLALLRQFTRYLTAERGAAGHRPIGLGTSAEGA